jgi:hypothetical protein
MTLTQLTDYKLNFTISILAHFAKISIFRRINQPNFFWFVLTLQNVHTRGDWEKKVGESIETEPKEPT